QALARMAFVRLEQPLPPKPAPAAHELGVLVVGAGPAGLAAAQALDQLGLAVTLVDKRKASGGLAAVLSKLFPRMEEASALLARLSSSSASQYLGCELCDLRKEAGTATYLATLKSDQTSREERFAAVILATGAQPVLPGSIFGADSRRGIISQMELDSLLSAVEKGTKNVNDLPGHAVFVQCVHARNDEKPYCSTICCPTAVKNALRLRTLSPKARVTVLNRQMVMPGQSLETLYRSAMQAGVHFVHVESLEQIRVEGESSVQAVVLASQQGQRERRLPADLLVCSTPLIPPQSTATLVKNLGLSQDRLGFLRGNEPAHPLESQAQGIFLAGSARWPATVDQAVEQGRAAAVLAAGYLRTRRMARDEEPDLGSAASIRQERCSGCGRCAEACPHGAIDLSPEGTARVCEDLCGRCGVCCAVCPSGAAELARGLPSPREIFTALSPWPRSRR
ncbi:MAG: CoB--CoM heterodisulfide reductase iron-sulfur subunit A family protein, partial [Desulfovibrio sp.]|nr:CoB--CoM heterodisulfide reductase iron-sulfur subunit A family protein [Desulfovibrio sp.]